MYDRENRVPQPAYDELIRLRADKHKLRLALGDMVKSTEEWNEAVQTIIGRVPGTGIDLVKAQHVLDETKERE